MALRAFHLLAIVALCCTWSFAWATTPADPFVEVQLCQEVHGFAGEVNDHLLIKLPENVPEMETPLYFIARSFPSDLMNMNQQWLSMNATVDGVRETTGVSNDAGIMRISGVSKGKTLRVNVNRVRQDGPVPFRLYSYQASTFTCAIPISESNSFVGPLPNDQSLVFFAISAPKSFPCATVWIAHNHVYPYGGLTEAPHDTRYFFQVDSSNKKHLYQGGDTICHRGSSTEPLVIAYYSRDTSPETPLIRISVSYGTGPASEAIPDSPGENVPDPEGMPSGGQSKNSGSSSGGGFFASLGRLLLIALLIGIGYLVAGSVYNYRTMGITTFPDYVPHIDAFQSAAATVSTMAAGRRHEYSPVDTTNYGQERNPFDV